MTTLLLAIIAAAQVLRAIEGWRALALNLRNYAALDESLRLQKQAATQNAAALHDMAVEVGKAASAIEEAAGDTPRFGHE